MNMNATGAKWVAIFVLGLVSFSLGMVPIKISSALRWTRHGCQRSPRSQLIISLLLCFGAGVLLATALTHMLPEVREHVSELVQDPEVWPPLKTIPLTEILLALGFFLVYGLDELVHMVLYRRQHSHLQHEQVKDEHHGKVGTIPQWC
ncbi:hypothetical protein B566_EDAN005602 [Ephemera danica]|nr:hypothetical protein B566_EDAN005602 [Ephemera danica]